ncbi:hypothetical protein K458DRAFT_398034 [Lentithecium fluviatile CBS 122367]|uniref:SRR1-like domain-containing protein n=1 Tax=Lentithecium fluviatile CBS 122367 TaxID=1168545 RepID=A0A6G1JMC8_9PLEO|nr:hypothetical protein K458DRAFT_398034 [Lentithecium fluviatile CBS 122367]
MYQSITKWPGICGPEGSGTLVSPQSPSSSPLFSETDIRGCDEGILPDLKHFIANGVPAHPYPRLSNIPLPRELDFEKYRKSMWEREFTSMIKVHQALGCDTTNAPSTPKMSEKSQSHSEEQAPEHTFDKIVCLGLGSPSVIIPSSSSSSPDTMLGNVLHLLAFIAVRVFAVIGSENYPLKVILYDREYAPQDKDFHYNEGPHVSVKDLPGALETIDKDTLVFARSSPGFPVRQILADITASERLSPKGFNSESEARENDNERKSDPVNRHVAAMIKEYVEMGSF